MSQNYKDKIRNLITTLPFEIDLDVKMEGRPPTQASSEFLTNKEQGDWAEEIVLRAINENSNDYIAVKYGRSDTLAAGDTGFDDFYRQYQEELNEIGKKPDVLIFRRSDLIGEEGNLENQEFVSKALAAIEVRSSSFLANKYSAFMEKRTHEALRKCNEIRSSILEPEMAHLLAEKSPEIFGFIDQASNNTFRELDFRLRSWSSSPQLIQLSNLLKDLKDQIKVLHRRDYLSITPKLEDVALVNRWIQSFGVRHYYLQVFFDKAYVISFKNILEIVSDSSKEDLVFSIERDVKNQGKTTLKIDVHVGKEILGKIDMPQHSSAMKELERGRLLFYVTFQNGRGYLDKEIFEREIVNDF